MYTEYLKDLADTCTNSFQLVQVLKSLRNEGHRDIRTRYGCHPIGKVMKEIVSMSKMGYSYYEIVDELVYNY